MGIYKCLDLLWFVGQMPEQYVGVDILTQNVIKSCHSKKSPEHHVINKVIFLKKKSLLCSFAMATYSS